MKKYFILFLLTISTFLTAQEEWSEQGISKWQIGQGNVAFGTSLSFTNISNDYNTTNILGVGDSRITGNNLLSFRNMVDFGIFSAGSSGTYLAYGLNNESMIYVSTDIGIYESNDIGSTEVFGNNLSFSYVYSNRVNDNVNINIAPYISVPFLYIEKGYNNDSESYNFKLPYLLGFNFVTSIKSDSIFLEFMFNYNLSNKKELEEAEYDEYDDEYYEGKTVPKANAYSIALYLGNNFSDSLSMKGGLLITSIEIHDRSFSQQLLQFAIENKISNLVKLGLTLEYVLESDMINDETNWFSLIGKMEFVF